MTYSCVTTKTANPFTACSRMDLTFALDSSGSIGNDGWRKMRDFVKEFIGRLTVNPDHVRVSVISFGNEATLHFGLADHSTLEETRAAVEEIPWKDQWTNTAGAIRMMTEEVGQYTIVFPLKPMLEVTQTTPLGAQHYDSVLLTTVALLFCLVSLSCLVVLSCCLVLLSCLVVLSPTFSSFFVKSCNLVFLRRSTWNMLPVICQR